MVEWGFKALQKDIFGNISAKSFTPKEEDGKRYMGCLEAAMDSTVPSPLFSQFFVKASIGVKDFYHAGNREYGFCQALHAEEAAVATFKASSKTKPKNPTLGIISESGATPCGNCRDILLDTFGENLEIVIGNLNEKTALVSKLDDFLFDDYKKIPRVNVLNIEDSFITNVWATKQEGRKITFDPYSPKDIHPQRRYFASLVTKNGLFTGSRDITFDYHPIYPLRDAIRQVRRAGNPYVDYVIILTEDVGKHPADVMYKDRQHLFELNLQQEITLGKQQNPKVYLVTQKEPGSIGGVWQTSVQQWLPAPFGFNI